MQVEFSYNKGQVIQALRYHFITRREIRLMIILVNVFAIVSAGFFYFNKKYPFVFLTSSVLWMALMGAFWFFLPFSIYRRERTFKDHFKASLEPQHFFITNGAGGRTWSWSEFSTWLETPQFFHLYFDSRSFFLLPKSAFGERVGEARAILRERIARKGA
ncbi:MAG TPA: YcxB family protein [Dinghuibacter sp.]|jgi:hypothetical protein|uniref:YcxB family protein n=1 Tax=Dinghuibacter sp. TaxID=2024697 RepID=UPI002B6FCE13|nr:YcxB family protein [Dinghuibacter sp.]HTJ14425.1 YcxB family protein [Dinghuibacter sp.]